MRRLFRASIASSVVFSFTVASAAPPVATEIREHLPEIVKVEQALIREARSSGLSWGGSVVLDSREKVQAKIKKRSSTLKFVEARAAGLQTISVILLLNAMEIVRYQLEFQNLRLSDVDVDEVTETVLESSRAMLVGGDLWFSLAGGSASEALFSEPLALVRQLIENVRTVPFFKQLLSGGLHSLITFSGFELGAQLWTEARVLLPNQEEFDLSANLPELVYGALHPDAEGYEMKRQVLGHLMVNLYAILFGDPALLFECFYNAWRHRIATGGFLTIVTGMSVAATAGSAALSAVVPNPALIVSFAFGLTTGVAGGAAAMLTPESIKESITLTAGAGRTMWQEGAIMGTSLVQIGAETYDQMAGTPDGVTEKRFLETRFRRLPFLLNPYIEALYRAEQGLKFARTKIEIGQQMLSQHGVTYAYHAVEEGEASIEPFEAQVKEDAKRMVSGRVLSEAGGRVGHSIGMRVGRYFVSKFGGVTSSAIDVASIIETLDEYREQERSYFSLVQWIREKLDDRLTEETRYASRRLAFIKKRHPSRVESRGNLEAYLERMTLLRDSVWELFLGYAPRSEQIEAYFSDPEFWLHREEYLMDREETAIETTSSYYQIGFQPCYLLAALHQKGLASERAVCSPAEIKR